MTTIIIRAIGTMATAIITRGIDIIGIMITTFIDAATSIPATIAPIATITPGAIGIESARDRNGVLDMSRTSRDDPLAETVALQAVLARGRQSTGAIALRLAPYLPIWCA